MKKKIKWKEIKRKDFKVVRHQTTKVLVLNGVSQIRCLY